MKLSKKLMALLVAGTMSVSAFALAACDNTNDNNKDDNKNNPGNTDNPGNVTPGSGSGTVDPTTKEGKFVNSLNELAFSAVNATFNMDMTTNRKSYTSTSKSTVTAKFDLAKGSGDINSSYTGEYSINDGKETGKESGNEYIYLREWNVFTEESDWDATKHESVKTGNLVWQGNVKDMMTEDMELPEGVDLSQILPEGTDLLALVSESAPAALGGTLSLVASLANAAGALTVSDTSATINVNLMAYNMANDLNNLVKGIKTTTTINDVLTSNYLKKYLMVFTEMVPVATVQAGLSTLGSLKVEDLIPAGTELPPQALAVLKKVDLSKVAKITPDANSTTYDYILKIMGSTELADLLKTTVNSVMDEIGSESGSAQMASAVKEAIKGITSITAIPLNFMVQFGMPEAQLTQTITGMQTAVDAFVKGNLTATSITIPSGEGGGDSINGDKEEGGSSSSYTSEATTKVSDATLKFTLSGGKVTGIGADAKYETKNQFNYGDASKNYSETTGGKVEATVNFVDSVSLADVNSKKVVYSQNEYKNVQSNFSGLMSTYVAKVVTDKNGKYTGVQVCDKDGNVLNPGNAKEFVIKTKDGEMTIDVDMYESSYSAVVHVYLNTEDENGYNTSLGYAELEGVKKYYENTVDGIVKGTASKDVTASKA